MWLQVGGRLAARLRDFIISMRLTTGAFSLRLLMIILKLVLFREAAL